MQARGSKINSSEKRHYSRNSTSNSVPVGFLFLFSLLILSSTTCSANIRKDLWPDYYIIHTDHFHAIVEGSTDEQRARNALDQAGHLKENMESGFFFFPESPVIRVYLYRDSFSYMNQTIPGALAHYSPRDRSIHIPANVALETWQHELSHALLEEKRPGLAFWLQEGLALFLQHHDFTEPMQCGRTEIRLKALNPYHGQYQNEPVYLSRVFDWSHSEQALQYTIQAGYFVFFLWQEERLFSLLEALYENTEMTAEYALTAGNDDAYQQLIENYRMWLLSDKPQNALKGC